jgi:hypothetical protein
LRVEMLLAHLRGLGDGASSMLQRYLCGLVPRCFKKKSRYVF